MLYAIIIYDNVFDTGDQVKTIPGQLGILGVNIKYKGELRTLSNAHVFTRYDRENLGTMIQYRRFVQTGGDFRNLFPVSDQVDVAYYTNKNQPEPTVNVMDIAWADVKDEDREKVDLNIWGRKDNVPTKITTSGTVRAPKDKEEFIVGNYRLYKTLKIKSLAKSYRSKGVDTKGDTIYTFWKKGIDFGKAGLQLGDSGTAMVATSDEAVIGLFRAVGPEGHSVGCRIVE